MFLKLNWINLIQVTMNIKFRRNLKLIEDEFYKSQTSLVLNLHHQIIFTCSNTSWTTAQMKKPKLVLLLYEDYEVPTMSEPTESQVGCILQCLPWIFLKIKFLLIHSFTLTSFSFMLQSLTFLIRLNQFWHYWISGPE